MSNDNNIVVSHGTDLRKNEIVRYTIKERMWHPWVGLIFFAVQMWMHSMWSSHMKVTDQEEEWSKTIKAYVTNRDEQVAPAGHFNHGQKQFYWIMYYSTLVLIVTGVLMWFPELVSLKAHGLMPVVIFLHCTAALFTIGAFLIHVDVGVVFVSRGLQGILWGHVPIAWAKAHHPLWYEKVKSEDRSRISSSEF